MKLLNTVTAGSARRLCSTALILALGAGPPIVAQLVPPITPRYACSSECILDNPDDHPPVPCESGSGAHGVQECQTSDHFGAGLAIADMNGDSLLDLVVSGSSKPETPGVLHEIWVHLNNGTTISEEPSLIIVGNADSDLLGWAVEFLPSCDGDNIPELLFSAPQWRAPGGEPVGRVYAMLSTSFPPLVIGGPPAYLAADSCSDVIFTGDQPGGWFGGSLAVGRFMNQDWYDLVIGAPGSDYADAIYPPGLPGALHFVQDVSEVASTSEGAPCPTPAPWFGAPFVVAEGSAPKDRFGHCLAVLGDVYGSGNPELAVGAPQTQGIQGAEPLAFSGSGPGYVSIFNFDNWVSPFQVALLTGQQVEIRDGQVVDGEGFGWSLAADVDIGGSTAPDLVVGAFRYDDVDALGTTPDVGRAWIYDGHTFLPLSDYLSLSGQTQIVGASASSLFSFSLLTIPDITDDERPELLAGAAIEWEGVDTGVACPAGCQSGYAADQGGRVCGAMYLVSLEPSSFVQVVERFIGERSRDRLGWDIAAGDLIGDGTLDLVMSGFAWTDPDFSAGLNATEAGRVYIVDGTGVN